MAHEALQEKLTSELATAPWRELAPHQARGALLLCDERCDLVEVAVALAVDDVQQVAAWLQSGAVRRPDDAEAAAFAPGAPFRFLIVQPFVVAIPGASTPAD